jgi:hypothetical protein
MAEPQYTVGKADDGTYAVEIRGGESDTVLVTTGFLTEQKALDWASEERRKAGHDARWPELRDE